MPDDRRYRVAGGCCFFTANLLQRRGNALRIERVGLLRDAVRRVRSNRLFTIDAWVVRPDHLHAVWTLPAGNDDFSTRWRLIKTFFVRGRPSTERLSQGRREAGERGIGQRRFWERAIRDDADDAAHVDDVHFNPVKHGLVAAPAEWPCSTFRSCVQRGLYPLDWSGAGVQDVLVGEPGG